MVDGAIISIYSYISILFIGYKHTSYVLYTGGDMTTPANHIRNQRRNQNARQAMMISGLSTIYRNQTTTHAIQTHQQTEPRIFLLDITLEDMNERMYSKIRAIIEKGRLRPKGTETFFVYKKKENVIMSEDNIYEIREPEHIKRRDSTPILIERIPVDGAVTLVEISISPPPPPPPSPPSPPSVIIPLLVDESHYKLITTSTEITGTHISPTHIVERYTKIIVKLHPKSANSFVFIVNENETEVFDFYFTTENGIIENSKDKITTTCKDDIISFIEHFKLCS